MTTLATRDLATPRDEEQLRRRLLLPASAVTLLGILHHADHAIRGNHVGWPLVDTVTPFTFSLGLYLLLVPGLYLTLRRRAWAGYWLFTGLVTLALVVWVHFNPDPRSEQLGEIYGPYSNPILGLIALSILFALILSLVALVVSAIQVRRISGRWR